ncbi:hypothetical protein C8Q70DRAFT_1042101 [Cubamyces menziesii]|nr:hypothetical protein C8Q70DRAFT_1042101 [Cubamyces menziesii]
MQQTQAEIVNSTRSDLQQLHANIGEAFLRDSTIASSSESIYEDEKREAFTGIPAITKEYCDELVKRWGLEIDTYLVYAGLFSAILTAFNVESYQLLKPPPLDATAVLMHISLQMSSALSTPPFINSTHPAFRASEASSSSSDIPLWAIWLNALWFSGLVLSLSAASIGILVKQWVNEFQSGLTGDSEHIARLRQYRLNNLERCRLASVVNAIPVLLQSALALFLAGLLVLLWNLHPAVAAITSFFISAIALFIVGTTMGPLITKYCAFLSSQSLAFYSESR